MGFTKRDIDRLMHDPDGPGTQIHYVGEPPGFGVRVFPSGVKSFVVWYRTADGRKRLHTLGKYGTLTLQQARQEARKTLAAVASGNDPSGARHEARKADTVRDFASVYMERHAKKHKKSWKEDQRRLDRYILPALGSKKLKDVARSDVARLHAKISTKPYEANRVVEVAAILFNKAIEWGHLPENHPNPAFKVKPFRERSRERWVTEEEMPRLWEAISAEENIYVRGALRLFLLTGVRKNELLHRRWQDVDFDRKELRLPTTKNGKPHTVPLSDLAVGELRALPRMLGNPYVFPSTVTPGGHLVNISKAWRRVRARLWLSTNPDEAVALREQAEADVQHRSKHAERSPAAVDAQLLALAQQRAGGMDSIRLHDLRRTVGSWMANAGVSLQVIGATLNNPSAAELYARLRNSAPREALEQHAQRLKAFVGTEKIDRSESTARGGG